MTEPSQWARERAERLRVALQFECAGRKNEEAALAAALDEAEQRGVAIGKMEAETTANLDSPTRPFSEFKADVSRYRQGRDAILSRLRNPDAAMVEAVTANIGAWTTQPVRAVMPLLCRALADVLAEYGGTDDK